MLRSFFFIPFLLFSFLSVSLFSASSLNLKEAMSHRDFARTGVQELPPRQRERLEDWIENYVKERIREEMNLLEQEEKEREILLLEEVGENGRVVVLEDGSVWDVSVLDARKARYWLRGQKIWVRKIDSMSRPFRLVNRSVGQGVNVRLIQQGKDATEEEQTQEGEQDNERT